MSLVTGSTINPPLASPTSLPGAAPRGADARPPAATACASPLPAPSSTVTLSAKAQGIGQPEPAAQSDEPSTYDAIKVGISGAVDEVENAVSGAARWVADGVSSVVAGADTLVHGALELPFAIGAKVCDAAGAAIEAL